MLSPTLCRSAGKTHVEYVSGPVRIKDALYMGDELAAKDMDFIVSNKVTHIINTVVKRVPNMYEKFGIQYLSVNWTDKEQNIFDKKNNAVNMIFTFIEEAMDQGESVLVHSLHGKSRSGCVVIAYLMRKYSWSLQKSFDFVVSKKGSFKIRSHFMSQLSELEKRISQTQNLSSAWNSTANQQDLTLANTFKNTKTCAVLQRDEPKKGKKRVSWGEKVNIGPDYKSQPQNSLTSTSKYQQFRDQIVAKKLRPILKNSGGEDAEQSKVQTSIDSIQISIVKQSKKAIENQRSVSAQEERLTKSQALMNGKNNGNGHVIVNNFMDKPRSQRYSSIPVKQQNNHNRKLESKSGSRLAPYENIISSIKSPYDMNFVGKVGESTKLRKREDPRQYLRNIHAEERPNHINFEQEKTTTVRTNAVKLNPREEILFNSSYNYKNRNAWPAQRENIIRYK